MAFKITNIFAFVCTEDDGTEGVMAFHSGMGWTPMVAADEDRLKSLVPLAQQISEVAGKSFRIKKFGSIEDVTEEVIAKFGK